MTNRIKSELAGCIFDGLGKGEEEIFPDPASQSIAEDWRTGIVEGLEREFKVFVPNDRANLQYVAKWLLPRRSRRSCSRLCPP